MYKRQQLLNQARLHFYSTDETAAENFLLPLKQLRDALPSVYKTAIFGAVRFSKDRHTEEIKVPIFGGFGPPCGDGRDYQ